MRHTDGVYYGQVDRHGETLHVADECDHVRWIKPEELVAPEPVECKLPNCFGKSRTWRKVYVRT